MRTKLLIEFAAIAVVIFSVWFLLRRIDFVNEDDLGKFNRASEKKLAELILKTLEPRKAEFDVKKVIPFIDSIGVRICEASHIPYDSIKIHIISSNEVNAFALPDKNMIIYTGLIEHTKNPEEMAGVMAHEIGHMEKKHVMKKLIKEIGISMLFVLTGGNENFEVLKETGRVLSSTAFDRSQEQDADDFAIHMLAKANIDPEPFGNFIFRLSTEGKDMPDELVWISTHPDSKERAAEIFTKKKALTFKSKPILKTAWQIIIDSLKRTKDADAEPNP